MNTAYGARIQTDLSKQGREFASDTNVINRAIDKDRFENRMQFAVKDAKAAGLHPLFALGTSGSSISPSVALGAPPSGSFASSGIARAGEAIADEIRARPRRARQTRLDAAAAELHSLRVLKAKGEIKLDDLEAQKRASDLAYMTQRNFWGDGDSGMGQQAMAEKLFPLSTRTGPDLSQRPLLATARQSHPETVESVSPDGTRMNLLNPDLGLDEVGQAEYLRLKAIGWTVKQLHAWAKRRKGVLKRRKKRVRRADPDFYGGS